MNFDAGHFYSIDGKPMHFVERKRDGGLRPTTVADARKLNLLPSVTQILKVLDKPALTEWKIRQAVMAVLTSPKLLGEQLDAFADRVLAQERQQDQETEWARKLGTDIHTALEQTISGKQCGPEILPWIQPCRDEIMKRGNILEIEKILVGDGYAGKTDLIQENGTEVWIWDWKSASKLPEKGSWPENRLQLSAYARAYFELTKQPIRTGNIYISTKECGRFVLFENPEWEYDYMDGFAPLVKHWQWKNSYVPIQ